MKSPLKVWQDLRGAHSSEPEGNLPVTVTSGRQDPAGIPVVHTPIIEVCPTCGTDYCTTELSGANGYQRCACRPVKVKIEVGVTYKVRFVRRDDQYACMTCQKDIDPWSPGSADQLNWRERNDLFAF
jgi:hypothetical protein